MASRPRSADIHPCAGIHPCADSTLALIFTPGLSPKVRPEYDGLLDCLRQTVRAEGVRGLYRGIVPNMLKAVPAVAISYTVFETSKKLLLEQQAGRQAARAHRALASTQREKAQRAP